MCRSAHGGGRNLDQQAVLDAQHAVHAPRQVEVVGGDQRGHARRVDEMQQRIEHVLGGVRVEVAGRLVGKDEARGVGQRAGDGGALLLAAGQLRGTVIDAIGEAEGAEQLRARACRACRRVRPRIICGMTTFSSAENSGSS